MIAFPPVIGHEGARFSRSSLRDAEKRPRPRERADSRLPLGRAPVPVPWRTTGRRFGRPVVGHERRLSRSRETKGGSMFAPARSALALVVLAVTTQRGVAVTQPARTPDLDPTIRARVGITAYSLPPIPTLICRRRGLPAP